MKAETSQPVEGLARRIAQTVYDLKLENLPDDVAPKATLIIRGGLSNEVAASAISEPTRHVIAMVKEWSGKPESTVVGYGFRVPAPSAAMCNVILGHGVELNDAYGSDLIKAHSVESVLRKLHAKGEVPVLLEA